MINNILQNAIESIPENGKVNIYCNKYICDNLQIIENHNLKCNTEYIKIVIEDTGTGISNQNLPVIFDPFFSTKFIGRGIGLPAAYSIISKHDGTIDVKSAEGFGTAFIIYLPTKNS